MDCKRILTDVLQAIDAGVVIQAPNDFPSDPSAYPVYLSTIHERLIERSMKAGRGPTKEVLAVRKMPFDFYLPAYNCFVEFDEDQHFTEARAFALSLYPKDVALGFDRVEWVQFCHELNRVDMDPPHRDEQRAWLDTIRDLAPVMVGREDGKKFAPTIRLSERRERICERRSEDAVKMIRDRLERFSLRR